MAQTKRKPQQKEWTEVTDKNSSDIMEIKQDIHEMKTNHLFHIEKDMEKQSKSIDKIDARLWYVLILLVASTAIGMIGKVI